MSRPILDVESSAAMKMLHQDDFCEVLTGHSWLPLGVIVLTARVVCSWELLIGGCLIAPPSKAVAHVAAMVLLIAFTVVLALSAWNGQSDHCGCGLWEMPPRWAMVRNIALAGLHGWLLVFDRHARKIEITAP